ncbi:MAG: ABC transporter ATP-binding protein [Erysipelotrichaceae bacterium]
MSNIKIKNLTRDYGNNKGVFDVSMEIKPGEVFGFLGPNGAGKTTTIRHLLGFLRPKDGSCQINDLDCWKDKHMILKEVGYIPGEIAFFDEMTGNQFLSFIMKYRKNNCVERKNQLIKYLDLDASVKIKKMSKGMKQKVGIVAAFMHDPKILILDEPTSGLDPLMQNKFIDLILKEKEKGKTILMSSHMFEEVERTCHRVAIIKNGKIVATDSIEELKANRLRKYVITFKEENSISDFCQTDLKTKIISNDRVEVTVTDDLNLLIKTLNNYQILNISAPTQSLEEIFLHYYGGEQ